MADKKAKALKIALIQMCVCDCKSKNLETAARKIKAAKCKNAKVIILPECFTTPYVLANFKKECENINDGPTTDMLKKAAKDNCAYIVGGSFPEDDCGKIYNTCTVWNPLGEMIAKYSKMHLFDIDIPGKIKFKESEVIKAGNKLAVCKIDNLKVGIGICYDMRFEELAKLYRLKECQMLIYPAAFNMTTGPLHFELLQRARAVDNQCYVCACSPARSDGPYKAWGFSQVTDPWGKVIAQAKERELIIYADIDVGQIDSARKAIPIGCQRRKDLYELKLKCDDEKKPDAPKEAPKEAQKEAPKAAAKEPAKEPVKEPAK